MTEPVVTDMQEARRRKLDELFADQPYLSVTMKASRLHERTDDLSTPVSIREADLEDDLLRRLSAARDERLTGSSTAETDRAFDSLIPTSRSAETGIQTAARSSSGAEPSRQNRAIESGPAFDLGGLMHLDVVVDMNASPPQVHTNLKPLTVEPDILTVKEAASYLRVSESSVRTWVREGRLTCARLGRRLRFRRTVLLQWIELMEVRG